MTSIYIILVIKFINTNKSVNNGLYKFIKNISFNKLKLSSSPFYSKFEFSVMKGSGGHILPHTDSPRKNNNYCNKYC